MEKVLKFDEFVNEGKIIQMKTAYNTISDSIDYEKLREDIIKNPLKARLLTTQEEANGLILDPTVWSNKKYKMEHLSKVIEYANRHKSLDYAAKIIKNFIGKNKHLMLDAGIFDTLELFNKKWKKEIDLHVASKEKQTVIKKLKKKRNK